MSNIIENLQDNKIELYRGIILEKSLTIEEILDKIILKYLIIEERYNFFSEFFLNKEFVTFHKKYRIVINLMRLIDTKDNHDEISSTLNEIIDIRNCIAHGHTVFDFSFDLTNKPENEIEEEIKKCIAHIKENPRINYMKGDKINELELTKGFIEDFIKKVNYILTYLIFFLKNGKIDAYITKDGFIVHKNKWFVLKIFPQCNNEDKLIKVHMCADKYYKELQELIKHDNYFFLFYTDVPEGSHFKLLIEHPVDNKINDWIKNHKDNDEFIKDIDVKEDIDNQTLREGIIARKVFEKVKDIEKNNLSQLKISLQSDSDYKLLKPELGQHYVRNMLRMTYKDEEELRNTKIK